MTDSERRTAFWPCFLLVFRNHVTSVAADGKKLYIIFGWPCGPPLLSTAFSASIASSWLSLSRPLKFAVCLIRVNAALDLEFIVPGGKFLFTAQYKSDSQHILQQHCGIKTKTHSIYSSRPSFGAEECSPCCWCRACTLWRSWPAIGQWPRQESPTAPVGSLTVLPTPSAESEEICLLQN